MLNDFSFIENQIGSDEVGTGDFFGPIVVVAVLFKKQDLNKLQEMGLKDSKQISNHNIQKIGKFIIQNYPFEFEILENERFNKIKDRNMNEIKCLMHHCVLSRLHSKHKEIQYLCIDQFVDKKKYNDYLIKNKKKIMQNLISRTKGEQHFPSVAAASIVARYLFLKEIEKINQKYHTKFPLGAVNKKIDPFAIKFINKNGIEEFKKITKNKFKNYQRILNLIKN